MKDPIPAVSGRGLKQLRRAAANVAVGVCEAEARALNEAFAKWIRTGLPLVTHKIAMTLDFKIAGCKRRGKSIAWITSKESRQEVQRMRHAHDALLTGIGTVLADDPLLTDRTGLPRRQRLLRVILDSRLRLPLQSKLVKSARGDVLVFTASQENSLRARRLRAAGVEVVRVPGRRGKLDLKAVLCELGRREILSVLLECGARLNGAALEAGVVDKLVLFYAPKVLGPGALPMMLPEKRRRSRIPAMEQIRLGRFGPDVAVEGYLSNVYGNH